MAESGVNMSRVVVFADEVARADKAFKYCFKLKEPASDVTEVLRAAVLNDYIAPGLGVNATLAISSLTLTPIGETLSGRSTRPLVLASVLDAARIVSDWWDLPVNTATLGLASAVSMLPRAAEISGNSKTGTQTAKGVTELFNKIRSNLKDRYRFDRSVSVQITKEELRNIVYGEAVPLDPRAL
eukprot:6222597-Amphidinium_carterae.1